MEFGSFTSQKYPPKTWLRCALGTVFSTILSTLDRILSFCTVYMTAQSFFRNVSRQLHAMDLWLAILMMSVTFLENNISWKLTQNFLYATRPLSCCLVRTILLVSPSLTGRRCTTLQHQMESPQSQGVPRGERTTYRSFHFAYMNNEIRVQKRHH